MRCRPVHCAVDRFISEFHTNNPLCVCVYGSCSCPRVIYQPGNGNSSQKKWYLMTYLELFYNGCNNADSRIYNAQSRKFRDRTERAARRAAAAIVDTWNNDIHCALPKTLTPLVWFACQKYSDEYSWNPRCGVVPMWACKRGRLTQTRKPE